MTSTVERVRLYGWVEGDEALRPVRALLFGQMVRRTIPVVQEYTSDLYHDALWITEHVTGTVEFEWLVRTSGTNIGLPDSPDNAARVMVQIGAPGGVFYRVAITQGGGEWWATFTQIPLDQVPAPQKEAR